MNDDNVQLMPMFFAEDMHGLWSDFHRERKYNLPHKRSEAYLRACEKQLADAIQTAHDNYNAGTLSTSEYISVVAFFNKGEL